MNYGFRGVGSNPTILPIYKLNKKEYANCKRIK